MQLAKAHFQLLNSDRNLATVNTNSPPASIAKPEIQYFIILLIKMQHTQNISREKYEDATNQVVVHYFWHNKYMTNFINHFHVIEIVLTLVIVVGCCNN